MKIFCCFFSTLIFCKLLTPDAEYIVNGRISVKLMHEALQFLDSVQNKYGTEHGRCKNKKYLLLNTTSVPGGGFASIIQNLATKFMRYHSLRQFHFPIVIVGPLRGYTEGPECSGVNHDLTCLLQPLVSEPCQSELLSTGTAIRSSQNMMDNLQPPQFVNMSMAWWWGIVQKYFLRLQPHVHLIIEKNYINMLKSHSSTYVKHESADSWTYPNIDVFPINLIYNMTESIEENDAVESKLPELTVGFHVRHGDKSNDKWKIHSLTEFIDSVQFSPDCLQSFDSETSNIHKITYLGFNATKKLNVSLCKNNLDELNLPVFVASDDADVITEAKLMGFYSLEPGISQSVGNVGMQLVLQMNHTVSYQAAIEIISDIYILSYCSTLVGLASSQVYRIAVGLSLVHGNLIYAVALDFDDLNAIAQQSYWYKIIVPEPYHSPDGKSIYSFRT